MMMMRPIEFNLIIVIYKGNMTRNLQYDPQFATIKVDHFMESMYNKNFFTNKIKV